MYPSCRVTIGTRIKLGATTVILALIQEVKATLRDGIYYYKKLGIDEIVDLSMVQCVVGRIWDQTEWAIVDRSDSTVTQVD